MLATIQEFDAAICAAENWPKGTDPLAWAIIDGVEITDEGIAEAFAQDPKRKRIDHKL